MYFIIVHCSHLIIAPSSGRRKFHIISAKIEFSLAVDVTRRMSKLSFHSIIDVYQKE